ncbi:hypothetical protein ENBRE01_3453, partial [Enteropsectra breve]
MDSEEQDLLELILILESSLEDNESLYYAKEWQENVAMMTPSQFAEMFRMSRRCFNRLQQKIIGTGRAIYNLQLKLMVFIFYIFHISSYRKIREMFGISHVSVFRIVCEISELFHTYAVSEICFPT